MVSGAVHSGLQTEYVARVVPHRQRQADSASIATRGLRKTYRSAHGLVDAVKGIDLRVQRGEFFGLLGPNGAGKSTTLGMLTTLVRPSRGRAWVAGHDVVDEPIEVKRRIGMVSQHSTLDRQLTAEENLEFRGRYFGMRRAAATRRARDLLELFRIEHSTDAKIYELSGGQIRRLMIARALMHRPEVLFLDEPTAGVDPQARINLAETLQELHADGQTIVLTTHNMQEAEQLCARVAIIDHGRLLACDSVPFLLATADDTIVEVTYEDTRTPNMDWLFFQPGVHHVDYGEGRIRVFTKYPAGLVGELMKAGMRVGLGVSEAATHHPNLESVYLSLTGKEYRG